MAQYTAVGVMSGSSLDGLDVCLVKFNNSQGWEYKILAADTLPLSPDLEEQLRNSPNLPSLDLLKLDATYGEWISKALAAWLPKDSPVDVIGIHGHTVFHEPAQHVSLQIGNGKLISQRLGVPVVTDFRSTDCYLSGQGAPLVPVGEALLMPGYTAFLNLGGIANIAIHQKEITAWDIAPCNQVLNHFSALLGQPYDAGGALAKTGQLNESWKSQIERMEYFHLPPPKSLANQWTANILSLDAPKPEDALFTYVTFLAEQITKTVDGLTGKLLVTGGGAFNSFLIEQLTTACGPQMEVIIPDERLISFKEALVFAQLGLLRKLKTKNVYASVTGATADSCSGTLHEPG